MSAEPRARLERALRDRRKERGMSQAEVAAAAGVSVGTVQSLEGTRKGWSEPRSLPAILRVLGYAPGSDRLIMAGEDPIPLEEAQAPTGNEPSGDDAPDGEQLPMDLEHEMRAGELVGYDVVDLDDAGEMRMIVMVRRTATSDDPVVVEAQMRQWRRAKKTLRELPESDESD